MPASNSAPAQLTIAANRVATLGRIHRHLHTLDKLESALVRQIHGELHFNKGHHDQGTRFFVTFKPQA